MSSVLLGGFDDRFLKTHGLSLQKPVGQVRPYLCVQAQTYFEFFRVIYFTILMQSFNGAHTVDNCRPGLKSRKKFGELRKGTHGLEFL